MAAGVMPIAPDGKYEMATLDVDGVIGRLKRCESDRPYVSISDLLPSVQDTLVRRQKWYLQLLYLQQIVSMSPSQAHF